MPFLIEPNEQSERYLAEWPDLTPEGAIRAMTVLAEVVANVSDEFRADPANRDSIGSPTFHHCHMMIDAGHFVTVRFHLDDATAAQGVLRLVYVDVVVGRSVQSI